MKFERYAKYCFLGLTLVSSAFGARQVLCHGGDGPTPFFTDISATLLSTSTLVKTTSSNGDRAGIHDFLFWESSSTLVYRNAFAEVRTLALPGNQDGFFTDMEHTLSQVVDPDERYLVAAHDTLVFDTQRKIWYHYDVPSFPIEPLFWHKPLLGSPLLYSMARTSDGSDGQRLHFYTYQVGDGSASSQCTYPIHGGDSVHVGHGHRFPDVVLYKTQTEATGYKLSVMRLDVRTCLVTSELVFKDRIPAEVQDVYRFDSLNSVVVKLNRSEHNLIWEHPSGCEYIDVPNRPLIVPSASHAVVGTWDMERGLTLFYLDAQQKAQLFAADPITSIGQHEVWLTRDGDRLFVAPEFANQGYRWLMQMELNPPRRQ